MGGGLSPGAVDTLASEEIEHSKLLQSDESLGVGSGPYSMNQVMALVVQLPSRLPSPAKFPVPVAGGGASLFV